MTTSLTKISTSSKITNFVTWPIQTKANSIRTSLPIIVYVATKMLANTSYLHSLLIAGITLVSSEFIYRQMNKSNNLNENLPEEYDAFVKALALEPREEPHKAEKRKGPKVPAKVKKGNLTENKKLLNQVTTTVINLKITAKQFVPLGKLLAHKNLCEKKYYEHSLAVHSFEFFKVNSAIIDEAWARFPKDDEYDSRLDFLSTKVDKGILWYFNKLKSDFNFNVRIMSDESAEKIIASCGKTKI